MEDAKRQPAGLNVIQLQRLEEHVHRGQLVPPDMLLQAAYAHLDEARTAQSKFTEVELELAESIVHRLDRLVSEWDTFSPTQQAWLRGAMRYFSVSEDEVPDFAEGGFRDDLDVLNACLRYVRRDDLVLYA